MPEIKISQSEVDSLLSDLKGKVEAFDISNPKISFKESRLDVLNEVKDIEENYYKAIEKYKELLLRTEKEMKTQIDQFIEKDRELANQIK